MANKQKKKHNVQFIMPPNMMKAKVGSGGLSDAIINRAQQIIERHTEDFMPLAKTYLDQMMEAIKYAKENLETEDRKVLIDSLMMPSVQLKANGAMFHYHIVTRISDTFVNFVESTRRIDNEILEIGIAFHSTIHAVIAGKIRKNGDPKGEALLQELESACTRYLEKHKEQLKQEELQRKVRKEEEEGG